MSFIAATLRSQGFVTLKIVTKELPKCASCYQTIRWRKPRWVPVSASKQFYVRTPTIFDEEETAELYARLPTYNTTMRAIRRYLAENYGGEKKQRKSVLANSGEEQKEYDMLMEENRQWNERVAAQREQRQAKEATILEARINRRVEKKLEHRLKEEEKAAKVLQTYMEEAGSYITIENLDEEIEKLLNSRKDYNYAINTDGEKITDSEGPDSKSENQKE